MRIAKEKSIQPASIEAPDFEVYIDNEFLPADYDDFSELLYDCLNDEIDLNLLLKDGFNGDISLLVLWDQVYQLVHELK